MFSFPIVILFLWARAEKRKVGLIFPYRHDYDETSEQISYFDKF